MTYVLTLIDGSYMIITEEQADAISLAQNAKSFKSLKVNDQFITLNQVTGIQTLEVFRRNMKHKLAIKNMRMCKRCHEIIPRTAECPCKDKPEKYDDILELAKKENPKLAMELQKISDQKLLS